MKVDALATLIRQSPTVALVLLVWWTLRDMAVDIHAMQANIAILVDRGGRSSHSAIPVDVAPPLE